MSRNKKTKNSPISHDNCVTAEIQSRGLSAKQALKKCKDFERSHDFEIIRIDAKTVIQRLKRNVNE